LVSLELAIVSEVYGQGPRGASRARWACTADTGPDAKLCDVRQRVSVITLGVGDLARARSFYEALGWETGAAAGDDVVFFQAGDMVLSLWDRARLAEDSGVQDAPGWGGVTLALVVESPEQVRRVAEQARAAGATIAREPGETFWGGYASVFVDPEGHPWEVAHNPHWQLTADGGVRLR
jgi:catechol 2,3-dioxygenase-like lactoylglutathione lyase family enzyme